MKRSRNVIAGAPLISATPKTKSHIFCARLIWPSAPKLRHGGGDGKPDFGSRHLFRNLCKSRVIGNRRMSGDKIPVSEQNFPVSGKGFTRSESQNPKSENDFPMSERANRRRNGVFPCRKQIIRCWKIPFRCRETTIRCRKIIIRHRKIVFRHKIIRRRG